GNHVISREFAVVGTVDHWVQLARAENVTDVTFVWGFSPPPVCQNSHHPLANSPRTLRYICPRAAQSFCSQWLTTDSNNARRPLHNGIRRALFEARLKCKPNPPRSASRFRRAREVCK